MTGTVAAAPARSLTDVARRYGREHLEVVGLVAVLLLTQLLPKSIPPGIYALGAVGGATIAIQAVGIVLVYRANRVINFAQVEIGAIGGLLFIELAQRRLLLVGVHYVCPACVRVQSVRTTNGHFSFPVGVPGWLVQANYWLSMALGLLAVLVLAYAVHALIIKRFTAAPRLILTLVTIGLAQMFVLIQTLMRRGFGDNPLASRSAPLPFHLSVRVDPITFSTTDIVSMVVAIIAVVALAAFLRSSALGVMLRGAADNPARAQSLGVNVTTVTSTAWVLAALLSGVAAILASTALGIGGQASSTTLVRILAAAVIGGMVSFPLTIVAALVVGMASQAVLWGTSSPPLVDGLLVLLIIGVLLLQRERSARADTGNTGWRASREVRPIPPELRDIDVVKRWLRNGQAILVIVGLGLPWVLSPSQTSLATSAFLFGLLGLSLLVLTGWAGQISLGQFAFAAVGAWTVAVTGWPFLIALPAGALLGAVAAVAIGLPALRLRGLHLAISTLAFAVGVDAILLNGRYLGKHLPDAVRRPVVVGIDFADQRVFYYFTLVFLLLAVGAVIGMRRSRTGRALIACRDNDSLAQAFGINLVRVRLSAFAISGFIAAFAGGLFAYAQFGVHSQTFDVGASINIFLVAVIGGMGTIAGPLMGAAFYGLINIFSDSPLWALIGTGGGVILVLLFLPGGLADGAFRIRDALLRRVAERRHIRVPSLIADGKGRDGEQAPIAPKQRPGGGKILVPARYRLDDQWTLEARRRMARSG